MDMLERVAKAIHEDAWPYVVFGEDERCMEIARRSARAAIAAMREPNEPMLATFHDVVEITVYPDEKAASIMNDRKVWAAMIDAALTSTAPQE